jgi:hypothetical protein
LLVALNKLRTFRPDLAEDINYIVYNRTNYTALEQQVDTFGNSKVIYDYYAASGFADFWPSRFSSVASSILNNILSAPTVTSYGVKLPISRLTCEPLLLSIFNNSPNTSLKNLTELVYLAHQARYAATGKFVAFSEGNTISDNLPYVYEYVVKEDGSTWGVYWPSDNKVEMTPIIYFKAAVGLLAMFDSTFTENMVSYVEAKLPAPTYGYSEGVNENGIVIPWGKGNTNGLIIQAAQYAVYKTPSPSPTPSQSPTPSPYATASPTPSPSGTPSPSQSATPSSSPYSTPTPSVSPNPNPTPAANPPLSPTDYPSSFHDADPMQSPSTQPSGSLESPSSSGTPTDNADWIIPTQSATMRGPAETQIVDNPLYYIMLVFLALFAVSLIVQWKKR